jgi:hypothetical protein
MFPEAFLSPEPEPEPRDPAEIIDEMMDLLFEYRATESDAEDLLVIEKVGTILQQLRARNQKEADGMMQGKITPRALRRAYG